jgi:hypothetical protein
MVFHYHVQREELLIVLHGRLSRRTAAGWEELPEGEVVAFPRGERGAHGYRNESEGLVRVLMISEMEGPNISVYPDTNQVGVFDAGQRSQRRFGALFNVDDAVADYGGLGRAKDRAAGTRATPSAPSLTPRARERLRLLCVTLVGRAQPCRSTYCSDSVERVAGIDSPFVARLDEPEPGALGLG